MANSVRTIAMRKRRSGAGLRRFPARLLVLALASTLEAADLPQGLLLHFAFDQAEQGGLVTDRSGRHNGRTAGTRWIRSGKPGGACEFTAADSHIVVTNAPSLNPTQLTAAVWFRTSKADTDGSVLLEKGMGNGYALTVVGQPKTAPGTGRLRFSVAGRGMLSDAAVTDGIWHHAAATYDGDAARLYVDGQPQQPPVPLRADIAANTNDLTVGMNGSNDQSARSRSTFSGAMDELMLFGRALSADEIRAVIASARPRLTKAQVSRRLAELKQLYDRGLILRDFYDRKVRECEDQEQ
jgi:hypothetical protein